MVISLINHLIVEINKSVCNVVEWLERRDCDQHGLGSKPIVLAPFCCVVGKDT